MWKGSRGINQCQHFLILSTEDNLFSLMIIYITYLGGLQIMVIDFRLTYPSGTATAHLINSFHTPHGAKLAK